MAILRGDDLRLRYQTGIQIYVDYIGGLDTNDGLSPTTPVQTLEGAFTVAQQFYYLPKQINIMRAPETKKGPAINGNFNLSVPWTAVNFNGVIINAQDPTQPVFTLSNNRGTNGLFFGNFNGKVLVNDSVLILECLLQASGETALEIDLTNALSPTYNVIIENSFIVNSDIGIKYVTNVGRLLEIINCLFISNNKALDLQPWDTSGLGIVRNCIFVENIVDVSDNVYEETGTGTGTVNKITDNTKAWYPSQWKDHAVVDGAQKIYKIVDNTPTELIVVGLDRLGNVVEVIPATGTYYIFDPLVDVFFYNNFWHSSLANAVHPLGDANADGIMDQRLAVMLPGIGDGRSTNIDIAPSAIPLITTQMNLEAISDAVIRLLDDVTFVKATSDDLARNVVAGMVHQVLRRLSNKEIITKLRYEADRRTISKAETNL